MFGLVMMIDVGSADDQIKLKWILSRRDDSRIYADGGPGNLGISIL